MKLKRSPSAIAFIALTTKVLASGTTIMPSGIIFPEGTTQTSAAGIGAVPFGTSTAVP